MKNSIGKPCEGKLHARFDVEGADCLLIFVKENRSEQSGSAPRSHIEKIETNQV